MCLVAGFLLSACNGGEQGKFVKTRTFPTVQVPAMMTSQADVLEWFSMHWWDNFFDTSEIWITDSTMISGVKNFEVEQAFANFLPVLDGVGIDQATKGIQMLYNKMEAYQQRDTTSMLFHMMEEIVSRYLYDPNSPVRNEDYYSPFARLMSQSPFVDEVTRGKYADEARRSSLNRIGSPAADFTFSDKHGNTGHLYGLKAEYTVMFFVNPGCAACRAIIQAMKSDQYFSELAASGRIAVMDIYIDENLDAWFDTSGDYPENWITAYDHNYVVRTEELYDVRAIPSLYLLDRDKNVLMKDVPLEKLLSFIHQL